MAVLLNEISQSTLTESRVTSFFRDSPTQPLTCHDRCDCSALEGDLSGQGHLGSCGAQAHVRVTLGTGAQIVFCGHHYAQHGPKIMQVSVVYDQRDKTAV